MRRSWVAALVAISITTSCEGSSSTPPSSIVDPSAAGTPSSVASAEVILEANLGDPPGEWREILSVPFGDRASALGFFPSNESAPLGPSSFAVGRNGFWIVDNAKSRIVRVDRTGRIRETIAVQDGFGIHDIIVMDDELWAIVDETKGVIGQIGSRGAIHPLTVHDEAIAYYPWFLNEAAGKLTAYVLGNIKEEPAGLQGFVSVDQDSGKVDDFLPGMEIGGGAINFGGFSANKGRFDVLWYDGAEERARRRVRVQIRRRDGTRIRTIAAPWLEARTRDGVAAYVQVASNRGNKGGAWYLQVPSDPSGALVFEPLPEGDISSDQRRHLAGGEKGHVYLMVTYESGIKIFRR